MTDNTQEVATNVFSDLPLTAFTEEQRQQLAYLTEGILYTVNQKLSSRDSSIQQNSNQITLLSRTFSDLNQKIDSLTRFSDSNVQEGVVLDQLEEQGVAEEQDDIEIVLLTRPFYDASFRVVIRPSDDENNVMVQLYGIDADDDDTPLGDVTESFYNLVIKNIKAKQSINPALVYYGAVYEIN